MVLVALLIRSIWFRAGLFALAAEPHPSTITEFALQADKTYCDTFETFTCRYRGLLIGNETFVIHYGTFVTSSVTHYEDSVTRYKICCPLTKFLLPITKKSVARPGLHARGLKHLRPPLETCPLVFKHFWTGPVKFSRVEIWNLGGALPKTRYSGHL